MLKLLGIQTIFCCGLIDIRCSPVGQCGFGVIELNVVNVSLLGNVYQSLTTSRVPGNRSLEENILEIDL